QGPNLRREAGWWKVWGQLEHIRPDPRIGLHHQQFRQGRCLERGVASGRHGPIAGEREPHLDHRPKSLEQLASRLNIAFASSLDRTLLQPRKSQRPYGAGNLTGPAPGYRFTLPAVGLVISLIVGCNAPMGAHHPTFTDTRLVVPPQFQVIEGTPQRLVKSNFILTQTPAE